MAEISVIAEIAGTVWSVEVATGAQVAAGAAIIVLESMKMEIPVTAPNAGVIARLLVAAGDPVAEGQVVAVIER
jgi:acetyl-CoA carboxylase biotin carboxyl carrier protein